MLSWIATTRDHARTSTRWRNWLRRDALTPSVDQPSNDASAAAERFEIDRYDPLLAYLEQNPRVMQVDRIELTSPAVDTLRRDGIAAIVPLVTHGKLIGIISLGPRLSGQEYSPDDFTLLENLATQSSAALRVAQLVREQQAGLQERERIAQQLRLARDIQKTLLPKSLPDLPGWQLSAYYRPAWEVGGDFYDFIHFPDGELGIIIGDVTDKGMPSALVMASTRSLLRSWAERERSPRAVLENANRVLFQDIPPHMFVTCFYLVLDPATGHIRYANAGHDLPYRRHAGGVSELRATGMPLGLMPDMTYEEDEAALIDGETIVFYSDGLVEAHNPSGEMLGFPRVRHLLATVDAEGPALIRTILDELDAFTGAAWRQEDDVTLVTLTRTRDRIEMPGEINNEPVHGSMVEDEVARFLVPSAPGNELLAIEQVETAVDHLGLPLPRLERLKTAVGEAVMNGMEHGNRFREDLPVEVSVSLEPGRLIVRVFDAGDDTSDEWSREPNLEAKLAGLESPRGWGIFLIRSMVDEVRVIPSSSGKTTELILDLEGSDDDNTGV
jgi:serine phosphatase RsbU (regulator of sigma subunit)/anti-sigma regulatory factor (Ser/Thr protein kinase)